MPAIVVIALALPLALQLVSAAADTPPQWRVERGCRAIAARSLLDRTRAGCMRSERAAGQRLAREWSEFPPADRRRCVALSTMGGLPSYVELLTCLELARDARALDKPGLITPPKRNAPASTTGLGAPDRAR